MKSNKTTYNEVEAFITKDQSIIRELMHPDRHSVAKQSLAEARVPVGTQTLLHKHIETEELYFITAGQGEMTLGDELFTVQTGDTVCIAPGTPHRIRNTGAEELVILCCSAPAYSHQDTELLEN